MTDLALHSRFLEDDFRRALPNLVSELSTVLTSLGENTIKRSHSPHIVLLSIVQLFGLTSEESFDHGDALGQLRNKILRLHRFRLG